MLTSTQGWLIVNSIMQCGGRTTKPWNPFNRTRLNVVPAICQVRLPNTQPRACIEDCHHNGQCGLFGILPTTHSGATADQIALIFPCLSAFVRLSALSHSDFQATSCFYEVRKPVIISRWPPPVPLVFQAVWAGFDDTK